VPFVEALVPAIDPEAGTGAPGAAS